MGDFNTIREDNERIGGNPRPFSAMEDFNSCSDNCRLIEVAFHDCSMFWCNGQKGHSRPLVWLNQAVANVAFNNSFVNAKLEYLTRKTSDHGPMALTLERNLISYGPTPFRFQGM